MMLKDREFYDKASGAYSAVRYPPVANSYTQFFFKRRLALVIGAIRKSIKGREKNLSVLEIGCADGVVLRKIYEMFQDNFSYFLGVDISPKMIESARVKHSDTEIIFKTRNNLGNRDRYDLIIEVGVINYASVVKEIQYAHEALHDTGYYICSVAGKNSLWNRRNKIRKEHNGFNNFLSYEEYEEMFRAYFFIENKIPVGFFIPLLWRMPFIARIIQPVAEKILAPFAHDLFHENIYLLKKKR